MKTNRKSGGENCHTYNKDHYVGFLKVNQLKRGNRVSISQKRKSSVGCTTSPGVREVQIKTIGKYFFILI